MYAARPVQAPLQVLTRKESGCMAGPAEVLGTIYKLLVVVCIGLTLAGALTPGWIVMGYVRPGAASSAGKSCIINSTKHTGYEYSGILLSLDICEGDGSCETDLRAWVGIPCTALIVLSLVALSVATLHYLRDDAVTRQELKTIRNLQWAVAILYAVHFGLWCFYAEAINTKATFTWTCFRGGYSFYLFYSAGATMIICALVLTAVVAWTDHEDDEDAAEAGRRTQYAMYNSGPPPPGALPMYAQPPAKSYAENLADVHREKRRAPAPLYAPPPYPAPPYVQAPYAPPYAPPYVHPMYVAPQYAPQVLAHYSTVTHYGAPTSY
jgi:hypothetical protein